MPADRLESFLALKRDHPAVTVLLAALGGLQPALATGLRAYVKMKARRGRSLPRPVISVGNITAGGTGKTSVVRLLLERFGNRGLKVALLYRGYKRKSKEPMVLTCGGVQPADPILYGDEPSMVSRWSADCTIFVNRDRYAAGLEAVKTYSPDVLVLDDGLQHVSLKRDLDIVLLDCTNPFDNGRILPFGLLREPLSALSRADVVLLTRCNHSDLADWVESVVNVIAPGTPVVRTAHSPHSILSRDGVSLPIQELNGRSVYLFSGIGNHSSFVMTALECGAQVTGHTRFPDHHWYSGAEMDNLSKMCRTSGADWLLTTEKDLVRIPHIKLPVLLRALSVRISMLSGADSLWSLVDGIVGPKSRNA